MEFEELFKCFYDFSKRQFLNLNRAWKVQLKLILIYSMDNRNTSPALCLQFFKEVLFFRYLRVILEGLRRF